MLQATGYPAEIADFYSAISAGYWGFFLVAKTVQLVMGVIKLKTVISPCKEIWQSWILNSAPWILHSGFFVSRTWIPESNYKWDAEYLHFIPDSTRKISQIPDSLRWGDSDPKMNKFSVKPKPVNWASNYCRLSVHVVLDTICLKRGFVDQVK